MDCYGWLTVCRHDNIDTMIVTVQCLLDDRDQELKNYSMRAREWFCWHFPEPAKVITDNIKLVGTRDKMSATVLSGILAEDVEERVKEATDISNAYICTTT